MQLSAQHSFLPKIPTVRAAQVMDHFGIAFEQGEHQIAQGLQVPIRAGEIILFHGESGSGKSSLLRAAVDQLRQAAQSVLDLDQLVWQDRILIDLLPVELAESMRLLSACGLGEAQLMLRTPRELSDGQRYRFRLAFALSRQPEWVVADEFTATLDRKLARVVSYNLRKLAGKSGTGFLLATTHEDVLEDLSPDVSVKCSLNGRIEVRDEKTVARSDRGEQSGDLLNNDGRQECPPHSRKKKTPFAGELWISAGSKLDWPYFARWHYRSHQLGLIKQVFLLWHEQEPVGICVFIAPPKCLSLRNRYFGRSGRWERTSLRTMNRQIVMLSRVVLHPTYRGAGIAAEFVRRCCRLCPWPWIETLTQMGHHNPFFERAGFVRVGVSSPRERSRESHSTIYGRRIRHGRQALLTEETFHKSRYASPVYYIFDNRRAGKDSGIRRQDSGD